MPGLRRAQLGRLSPANVTLVPKGAVSSSSRYPTDFHRPHLRRGASHDNAAVARAALPEARPCVRRHSPPSADPGGRIPGSPAGGSRATTRGAMGPKMAPNQYAAGAASDGFYRPGRECQISLVILPGFEAIQCTPPCVLPSAERLSVDNRPQCVCPPFCLCNFVSKIQLSDLAHLLCTHPLVCLHL